MKDLISISETVAEIPTPQGDKAVVHVSVDGKVDEERDLLTLVLDCELRSSAAFGVPEHPSWLPPQETLREQVSPAEATTLAREVFQHWVNKVRRSIPEELAHSPVLQTP